MKGLSDLKESRQILTAATALRAPEELHSLRYLCSCVVRIHTKKEHVEALEIPTTVKEYIRQVVYSDAKYDK